MDNIIDWLLSGPAWVKYRCLIDLLDIPESDNRVIEAREAMNEDPLIKQLFIDAGTWETSLLKRHNDAEHPIHKLCFLADLGFTIKDPKIEGISALVMSHQDNNGPFLTFSNYPTHFGGTGQNEWLWALCDAPLLVYALSKFGLAADQRVKRALESLSTLVCVNGWPCAVSAALGKFRGPGKKGDPCPYANLVMLKALSSDENRRNDPAAQAGIEVLLSLWDNSLNDHPYLFNMGTDFRKLKAPFIWYDILHIAFVLANFPQTHTDSRFQAMLEILRGKAGPDGHFTSESIWTKWKGWEFCQKKEPSRWVTLNVLHVLKQAGEWTPG